MFYLLLAFSLLMCWRPASAQKRAGLSVGDTVPDVLIRNVLNYRSPVARISDFKGKLLILDFWATWCKPCVMMVPRMDSLEKHFDGKLQFLPVTYQSRQQVAVFRDKLAKRTGHRIQGPEVVSDSVLSTLFVHNAVPHYVWVNAGGKVVAITGLEEITRPKLAAYISGSPTALPTKTDEPRLGYSAMDGPLSDFLARTKLSPDSYRTFFSPHIKGLRSQAILKEVSFGQDHWRMTLTNVTALSLYKYAYGEGRRFFSMNTIELQTRDSLDFYNNFSGAKLREWIPSGTYCYEMVVPAAMAPKAFGMLRDDLSRLLPGYLARTEKRQRQVLALIRTSDHDRIGSKTARFSESYDKFTYQVRRKSMTDFVTGLNGIYMNSSKLVIVDMTGYKGFIDLDLDVNFARTDDVNRGLARYGLRLVERTADIDVLVISDAAAAAQ